MDSPLQDVVWAAAWRKDWPLYGMEGVELGIFMLVACVVDAFLFTPEGRLAGSNPWLLRLLMGASMGLTAVGIIRSPWGRQSGAQFNPAVTLTFWRLGKIGSVDAAWYCVAHFVGGAAGVGLAWALVGQPLVEVHFAVTVPGLGGVPAAFVAELGMAAGMMSMVLWTAASPRWQRRTPLLTGLLITGYVVLFAPISGFSINPARTVASALWAGVWTAVWLYFVAPIAGMLAAAELWLWLAHRPATPPGVRPYLRHRHLVQRSATSDSQPETQS